MYFIGALVMFCSSDLAQVSANELMQIEENFEGGVHVLSSEIKEDIFVVTVQLPYRDMQGSVRLGQARLYVRKSDIDSRQPIPIFCHVHYEKDFGGAARWCRQGWAVVTPHYTSPEEGAPIDASPANSENQSRAMLQWARRLKFADRTRLHIDGGSQGGYMALAMAAEFFPVRSVTADAPVVNWAYNLNYFERNKALAKYPQADMRNSPLPVLCSVMMLSDWCYKYFSSDLTSETWYRLSPISFLTWITSPVLMMCATGDLLVPIGQVDRSLESPIDIELFPENFEISFDALAPTELTRKTLVELLPREQVWLSVQKLQEGATEITLAHFLKEEKEPPAPQKQPRPWSKEKQWSIVVLDEGPPAPYSSHTRYRWSFPPDEFVNAHREIPPAVTLLTQEKLSRLLQRYTGMLENLPTLTDGTKVNRLNFSHLEQWDVITGLLDYVSLGEIYKEHLEKLYESSPIKPFGDTIELQRLKTIRDTLLPTFNSEKESNS